MPARRSTDRAAADLGTGHRRTDAAIDGRSGRCDPYRLGFSPTEVPNEQ